MSIESYPKCPGCKSDYAYIGALNVCCINTDCFHYDEKHSNRVVEELTRQIYPSEKLDSEKNLDLDFEGSTSLDYDLKNYINDFSGDPDPDEAKK